MEYLKQLFADPAGCMDQDVKIGGWIRNCKKSENFWFHSA